MRKTGNMKEKSQLCNCSLAHFFATDASKVCFEKQVKMSQLIILHNRNQMHICIGLKLSTIERYRCSGCEKETRFMAFFVPIRRTLRHHV